MSETLAKVAASIADAIKVQPLATTIVVLNLLVLSLVYFGVQRNLDRYERQFHSLLAQCAPKGEVK